jgi:integrase/recombinase XerD
MTSLRQRMIEDMQVRNLSKCTQNSYVRQVSLFARHFKKSPELLGPEQIRAFQIYLMNEKKLAPISILVAISALRFLYGVTLKKDWSFKDILPVPKKPQTLPIVLSPEEVIGRRDRLFRRTSQLGTEPAFPSSSALCRSGWRDFS